MSLSRLSTTRSISHLLLSGYNPLSPPTSSSLSLAPNQRQSPSNPSLAPAPFPAWLASVGRQHDGPSATLRSIAGGAAHNLLTYRNHKGVDRILALGTRNEAGQLGLGFASQEGTRGLVEGFEGEEVLQVAAGVAASYLLVRTGQAESKDSTALYSFGNLSRGRLGQPSLFSRHHLEADEEPRMHILPRATAIQLPQGAGRITQIEAGFEHLLVLTEDGTIFGTGCNTDGQLGLGGSSPSALDDLHELTQLQLPSHLQTHEGGIRTIRAGADTSALITESGKIWTWGNSEYAQALHGRTIDQISAPLAIDLSFLPSPRRIADFRCGGSFSFLLDDRGSVYSCGYGALGLGKDTLQSLKPRRIDKLEGEGVSRISAGWGYAAAVRDAGSSSALWTWGLNSPHGRLGLGTLPPSPSSSSSPPFPSSSDRFSRSPSPQLNVPMHVYEPTRVELPMRELGLGEGGEGEGEWRIGEVETGEEGLWVVVQADDGIGGVAEVD
ncbi:hypothetical protein JCM11641_000713 [Rhodosporidiobolus odoratus]